MHLSSNDRHLLKQALASRRVSAVVQTRGEVSAAGVSQLAELHRLELQGYLRADRVHGGPASATVRHDFLPTAKARNAVGRSARPERLAS